MDKLDEMLNKHTPYPELVRRGIAEGQETLSTDQRAIVARLEELEAVLGFMLSNSESKRSRICAGYRALIESQRALTLRLLHIVPDSRFFQGKAESK